MSKSTFKEFDLFSIFSPIWESRGSKNDFLQLCHILSCNTSKCADFLSEKQRMGVFVKIFHFWPILCPFLAKLSPKVTFSLKHGAFLLVGTIWDLRLQMGLVGILASTYKVVMCQNLHFSAQNGLRTLQFEILEIWIWAVMVPFLVGTLRYLGMKIVLFGLL